MSSALLLRPGDQVVWVGAEYDEGRPNAVVRPGDEGTVVDVEPIGVLGRRLLMPFLGDRVVGVVVYFEATGSFCCRGTDVQPAAGSSGE